MNDEQKWWLEDPTDEQGSAVEPSGPPAPPYQPYAGPYVYQPPASRKMAGWALGLSLVPCLISQLVAMGLAITALVLSRDGRAKGKGMAIAALCIVSAWIIGVSIWVAIEIANDADRDASGNIESKGEVSTLDLHVGDCFQIPQGEEVRSLTALPCDQAHDAEVFHDFKLPDGSFQGTDPTFELARLGCIKEFRQFVGTDYQRSSLDVFIFTPTKTSWALDDRGVTCAVYEPTQPGSSSAKPLTGTLRNSNR